jgi:arylsulfatase A-like enzyme
MWLFLLAVMGCDGPDADQAELHPDVPTPTNVLIISLDTVSAQHLSLYGGRAKVPHLEAMASAGTTFDAAISHFPETALSHWSMLTGVLPTVHGNVPATGTSRYTGPTLAERLRAAGYSTGAFIGGETLTDRSTGLSRGFDVYDDRFPWDRKDLKRPGSSVVASAKGWIEERSQDGRPFFAFVHLFDAHFPYTPSPPWDTAYATDYAGSLTGSDVDLRPYRDGLKTPTAAELAHIVALYEGELSALDAIIAPLLTHPATEDALVIVTSDHGESFGHGYWFNHRDGLWDEISRVPLVIRGPGVPRAQRRAGVVGLVDVSPTVLDVVGLAPLERVNGQSLRLAESGGTESDRVVFSITDPWRTGPKFSARTATHKLIARAEDGLPLAAGQQGFDLIADPGETTSVVSLPERFESVGGVYQAELQAVMARWQGPESEPRQPDVGEVERLKALGYVDGPAGVPAQH